MGRRGVGKTEGGSGQEGSREDLGREWAGGE